MDGNTVNELIHGRWGKESFLGKDASFFVLALEFVGGVWKQWTKEEADLWFYAVKNIAREIIPERVSMYFWMGRVWKDHMYFGK